MQALKKALSFFVHGRFYIATAALLLVIQSSLLFSAQLPALGLCAFVFFATLFAYSIYYIDLKKPEYPYHKVTTWVAAMGAVLSFFFVVHDIHWGVFILLCLYGGLYTFSRYLPFKLFNYSTVKICLLTAVWILAVVFLPFGKFIPLGTPFYLFALHQFIFIFILNFLFDIKDIEFDEKKETASLATKFGEENSYFFISALEISLIVILYFIMSDSSALLSPYIVPLLIGNIGLTYSIRKTKSNRNIYNFLLFIDGLMLLQCFLVIFTFYAIRYA